MHICRMISWFASSCPRKQKEVMLRTIIHGSIHCTVSAPYWHVWLFWCGSSWHVSYDCSVSCLSCPLAILFDTSASFHSPTLSSQQPEEILTKWIKGRSRGHPSDSHCHIPAYIYLVPDANISSSSSGIEWLFVFPIHLFDVVTGLHKQVINACNTGPISGIYLLNVLLHRLLFVNQITCKYWRTYFWPKATFRSTVD